MRKALSAVNRVRTASRCVHTSAITNVPHYPPGKLPNVAALTPHNESMEDHDAMLGLQGGNDVVRIGGIAVGVRRPEPDVEAMAPNPPWSGTIVSSPETIESYQEYETVKRTKAGKLLFCGFIVCSVCTHNQCQTLQVMKLPARGDIRPGLHLHRLLRKAVGRADRKSATTS
jgi:hypothetical protein